MKKEWTVYKHTAPNGKVYIGITCRKPEYRWKNGKGYIGQIFGRAIEKYGWDNIQHEIIATGLTKEEAEQMEIELIAKYKSNQKEFGYNIANGGNSVGMHSEETKKKISESITGENNPMYGKKHSEETRQKIREKTIGRKWSEESKKKVSETIKRKKCCFYGRHHTEETKQRLREIKKGFKHTEESRKKISEAQKGENNHFYGKHHTEETKRKMSENHADISGKNNPKSKKVYCNKIIFVCVRECAEFYGIPISTMTCWLNGSRKMRKDFLILELRYATEEDINTYPLYNKNIKQGE